MTTLGIGQRVIIINHLRIKISRSSFILLCSTEEGGGENIITFYKRSSKLFSRMTRFSLNTCEARKEHRSFSLFLY